MTSSGGTLNAAKNLSGMNSIKATKDVTKALNNLKNTVELIPELQNELSRATDNLEKLLTK